MAADNPSIARILRQVGDLLQIKGANPFKIRAYRNASEIVADAAERVAELDESELRAIPGIGKDLAAKIREISETGTLAYHRELLEELPVTLLDLLELQGLGPKTVALLYGTMDIATVDDLETAAAEGRLRGLRGLGPKREALLLRAIGERRRRTGRHLIADAEAVAARLMEHLSRAHPELAFMPVGSLRRGAETCGDVDILSTDGDTAVLERFVTFPDVDRILGQGTTKASVLLTNGVQADLRVVPAESAGAAMQYFTGSKPHNIALRDRALQRGLRLNEYGLFHTLDGERVAGATETEIYAALGLAFVPPELRENRGEIAAAEQGALPALVTRDDIRGDLHCHTTATDGQADIETMARAALDAGHEYLAITDHSQALAMANGLDESRALAHARAIRDIDRRLEGITLLAGIECDIRTDGTLDLSEDCLAELDLVIASVHSGFGQEEAQMTDRMLRAIESPAVDIIGHPTGRLLLRREPYRIDVEAMVDAAARHGVALEINSQVHRLDLGDTHAALARERGVPLVVSTDAHAPAAFGLLRWGILVARRAWLEPRHVLNTRSVSDFRAALRRAPR
jgi:DNA polymerase (family 10)